MEGMGVREPIPGALQRALDGRYVLERRLGRGGMGVVYLAREPRLARRVAIKVLPPERALQPAARERFLREARTAAGLSHPNIVPIFAVDEVGDVVFFVMAYVEGESLGQRVRARGPLAPAARARWRSRRARAAGPGGPRDAARGPRGPRSAAPLAPQASTALCHTDPRR